MLAGLALQADLGDKSDSIQPGYFRPEDYVPPALRTPWGIQTIETHHNQNRDITQSEAEMQYIQEVCQLHEPINAHIFRLRVSKQEVLPGSILLAVCAHGVKVYPDNNPASTFLWGSIGKLSFERKKFEIRTGHEKLTLYTTCDEKSKLLLALCRDTHQFSMAMAPRLSEAKKEVEKQRFFGNFYSYSRIPRHSARPDQRISVISNTSSNTTSGIVSDRVHSEDELEILITCPPAQSTESLALAHLMDNNLSRQASSRSSISEKSPLTNTIEAMTSLKLSAKNLSSSSSSLASDGKESKTDVSHRRTKFTGSQCSSSCSTVVVSTGARKLTSATSSLELGFSHTAQNSTVSDATCFELDIRENASGVFTTCSKDNSSQTSGIHTIESSFMGEGSVIAESTTEKSVDQPDGATYRDRSNSNISSVTSFRGDGSDPTDNKQALSAQELSNLIVGRGVYPSHQTVSNTLDSDSDYVTISSSCQGFPPIPPKRFDSNKLTTPGYSFLDGIQAESIKSRLSDPPPYTTRHHDSMSWYAFSSPSQSFYGDLGESSVEPPPYPYGMTEIPVPMYPRGVYTPEKSIPPPIPPKHPLPKSQDSLKLSAKPILLPYNFLPPPPPQIPRQPPPPPPGIATVYTKQLSQSQIEQYQQQMHSDVDFVVFPLKEPSISKQEYLDAKHGSLMSSLAARKPLVYRSTPYLNIPFQKPSKYASTHNLADTPSTSEEPVYHPSSLKRYSLILAENNAPPRPPSLPRKVKERVLSKSTEILVDPKLTTARPPSGVIDIRTLREKSKNLDLPLISALCNDRSLLKQTKAFVMPKHPPTSRCESSPKVPLNAAKLKYPVSGFSNTQLSKKLTKKNLASHRHPSDKLPDIPRAAPNNYVVTEPRAKHLNKNTNNAIQQSRSQEITQLGS